MPACKADMATQVPSAACTDDEAPQCFLLAQVEAICGTAQTAVGTSRLCESSCSQEGVPGRSVPHSKAKRRDSYLLWGALITNDFDWALCSHVIWPDPCMQARLIEDFDDAVTSKLTGFKSTAEYYKAGSSGQFIPHVSTPALLLTAHDDPFLGALPTVEVMQNQNVMLAVTKAGGHCAHLRGWWPFAGSWADCVAMQFIRAAHSWR